MWAMPTSVIFLHLQKTGGTSIRKVMRLVFGHKKVGEGMTVRADGVWSPMQKRHVVAEAWMGHMSFGLHTQLRKPAPYFTVLREPVRRQVSRYCSMPQLRFDQRLSITEAIDPEWGAVFQLSGIPRNDIATLGEEHVDLALKNLHGHFLFVGDTFDMDKVGRWMRGALGWQFELPLPHENRSGTGIEVTEEEISALRQHPQIKLDQLLYERVQELGPYPKDWRL
jgi:hypothetical protein